MLTLTVNAMRNYSIMLILTLFVAVPAWAQEEEQEGIAAEAAPTEADSSEAGEEAGETADAGEAGEEGIAADAASTESAIDDADEAEGIVDPDFEDADLDVQIYEEDDDDFVPTEEIPADEPIPFPSNI